MLIWMDLALEWQQRFVPIRVPVSLFQLMTVMIL